MCPCGFVILDADPWLGAGPDGYVRDRDNTECPNGILS